MTTGVPVTAGGDLHYHLSQHGVFSEAEMRFYAAEIILGLEHMHSRFVVYRDLKVTDPTDTSGTRAPAGTLQVFRSPTGIPRPCRHPPPRTPWAPTGVRGTHRHCRNPFGTPRAS